jgi:putative hemolysin
MSVLLCLLAVVASALCSGLETGLYCTSRLRIVLDAAGGRPAARRLQSLLTELPLVLTVLLVVNNVATWAASYLVQAELERHGIDGAEALGAIGVTVVLFVFGESVPKNLFRARQHELLYPLTPVLVALRVALGWLVWPIVAFARLLSDRIVRKRMAPPPRLVPEAGAGAGAALGGEGDGKPEVVPPGAPAGGTVDRESLLVAGAAEGLLTGFQQRVARGVLLMRSRTAADEARPVADHPLARLGVPGVALPPDCREHRVLVLEEDGQRVAGWMPLAALASGTGFRAALRSELRPVARIAPETSLDRVYLTLDRTGTPFAAVGERAPLRVVDGRRLRQRVMGVAES